MEVQSGFTMDKTIIIQGGLKKAHGAKTSASCV